MIKVIFFDAVGTLIHLPGGVGHHYGEVARRHGLDLNEADLTRAFRLAWKEMPPRPATHFPRPDDDKGWWRDLVNRVLEICGAADHGCDGYFEELYARFAKPGVWELYPESRKVLERLAETYTLGIISNFDGRLRTVLDHLGVTPFFESIVISSEAGADKPDAFIFEKALQSVSAKPHEALHVGDDAVHDLQGAKAAGMHAFHLVRPEGSLRDLFAHLQTPGS